MNVAAPPHSPKSCPRDDHFCLPLHPAGGLGGGGGVVHGCGGDTDPGAPGKALGTWARARGSAPSWVARAGSPGWASGVAAEPWGASWQGSFFPSDLTAQFTMAPPPSRASWAEPGLLMDILREEGSVNEARPETQGGSSSPRPQPHTGTHTRRKLPLGAPSVYTFVMLPKFKNQDVIT